LVPAAPLTDQLRNDLALLLAPNLPETLQLLPIPGEPAAGTAASDEPVAEFMDCLLGMWAFSRELVRATEALAGPIDDSAVISNEPRDPPPPGEILR
jgi:hypothetical protein